ncbi:hypothetical protein H4S07_001039 [Coemansia furcata]|uniref:Uncharacterized protein n=1 Tax=Coemansia furcata TaxID=417177 RepID=A0ACC1LNK4_9FUNG|nr:hypothetical protein H4S07_001039 [Coemansia furcata]
MVCAICYEPYFKALPKSVPGRESASSAAASLYRLATLGCGHVFHKKCIDAWFATNTAQRCAQCNVVHVGPPTVLFLDKDDDDDTTKMGARGKAEEKNKGLGGDFPRTEDMDDLALAMASMGIYNRGGEYYVATKLTRQNIELESRINELAEELEETNRSLEIGQNLREEDDVNNLKLELEEERNLRRRSDNGVRMLFACIQHELLEVARLSSENKKLKELHSLVARLRRMLASSKQIISAYEDRFGPYLPSDFTNFSHTGMMTNQTKRSRKD